MLKTDLNGYKLLAALSCVCCYTLGAGRSSGWSSGPELVWTRMLSDRRGLPLHPAPRPAFSVTQ
eukprot:4480502-Alexandrium_andersonii.AAC.1